jgi:hypothetical protein
VTVGVVVGVVVVRVTVVRVTVPVVVKETHADKRLANHSAPVSPCGATSSGIPQIGHFSPGFPA